MSDENHQHDDDRAPYEPARVGAFVDAVVAIAMTLLILPLMDSVTEVSKGGDDTAQWFGEHHEQITSFVVSFLIIGMFWTIHHRMFVRVEHVTNALMWATMAWLLTIVWLPVATAISGQMGDQLAKVVYIGSMIVTSLCSLAIRIYLYRNHWTHRIPRSTMVNGIAADLATAFLFAVALTLSLLFPALSYFPLFIMLLSGFTQSGFARLLGATPPVRKARVPR